MSYKTQVALGKNTTLQKQLEDKFVEFKRSLKYSRRRLDGLEEECLTALYKLIVDTKEGNGGDKSGSNNNIRADPRQTKSANPRLRREQSCLGMAPPETTETPDQNKRPATAMCVKNYRQSYSFIRNGLNIDQSRRDRFLRNKKQKEDKAIEIRRGNVHWAAKNDNEERPKTASFLLPDTRDTEENNVPDHMPTRPFTAEPYNAKTNHGKLLKRGQMANTLTVPLITHSNETSTPDTRIQPNTGSVMIQTPAVAALNTVHTNNGPNASGDTQTVVSTRNCDTPDGESSPIGVRISITKHNDRRDEPANTVDRADTSRVASRYGAPEDELLPLGDEDKRHLETIMSEQRDGRVCVEGYRSSLSPRPHTGTGSRSRQAKTPIADVKDVEETAVKTQSFLNAYAKKSKLLGYVVKTRSSSAAPREKSQKNYRSPCITYQELVSIKANIKQQESKTRLLLQRSAKLAKYVDNLANAGNVRKYLQTQNAKP